MSYDTLIGEAESVGPGAEGLAFLPYLTGERTPHLDPEARGVFFGLTARHTRAHMTRALVEGVLFSLRDGLEIMRGLGVRPATVVATGGGSSSPLWLRLQADVYNAEIRRTAIHEGAAYGAALLGRDPAPGRSRPSTKRSRSWRSCRIRSNPIRGPRGSTTIRSSSTGRSMRAPTT
jgi:xylulokinase